MPTTRRYELSDAQWAHLEPLLPPEKPGRPNDDHRRILNGILWILNSVARPAAALWSGRHGVEPVLPLAGVWPDQPVEKLSTDRHKVRKACRQLSRHDYYRSDSSLALNFADTYYSRSLSVWVRRFQ